MKAMTIRAPGGLHNLVLVDRDKPQVGAGDVLVRMRASSLNYHDYLVATGTMQVADGLVAMSDAAGEVVETGAAVTQFREGDRVMPVFYPAWQSGRPFTNCRRLIPGDTCDGFAAEYVAVPESWLTRMPAGYEYGEAASLVCAGLTAWAGMVRDEQCKEGDTVLVMGTGGVSIFALQFAKALGAKAIVTSSSDEKLERAKTLGADHCINYRTEPNWGAVARELTGGEGVDLVIEVGGAATLERSLNACREGGRISMIGVLGGFGEKAALPGLITNQITIEGLAVGSRADQIGMIETLERTGIWPVIDRTFPLAELAEAYRYQESGAHFGKICIDI